MSQQTEHGLNTMTSFSRLQGNTSLSIQWNKKRKAWKANKSLHLHARSGHGLHSCFLYPCLWFLCHIVETNQIYLDVYDISKMLPYLLQIQHCSYCIYRVQLQPEKRENRIQLMWFTLPVLILRLPSPSLLPKRFFK